MYVFHLIFCNYFTLLPPALLSPKIKILNFIELELSHKMYFFKNSVLNTLHLVNVFNCKIHTFYLFN